MQNTRGLVVGIIIGALIPLLLIALIFSARTLFGGVKRIIAQTTQRQEMPVGWVLHQDPLGFQVAMPPGWVVNTHGAVVQVMSTSQKAGVLVIPVLVKEAMPAEEILRATPSTLNSVFPHAKIVAMKRTEGNQDVVIASLQFQNHGIPGQASLLCAMRDRSGMLYAMGGPTKTYNDLRPQLLTVLQSFQYTTPTVSKPPAPPEPAITFTRFADPNEGAFTVEVPEGWQVSGGLTRRNALDCRNVVHLVSPDGRITVICGDPSLHGFINPMPEYGYGEGRMYPLGSGITDECRSYRTGAQFAYSYARNAFSAGFAHCAISDPHNRPQAAKATNAQYRAYGLPMNYSTGDVTFTGTLDGQPMHGYCFVGVVKASGSMGGGYIWNVDALYGYRAPVQDEAIAKLVFSHMIKTMTINPEWAQRQSKSTMNTAAAEREKSNAFFNAITSAYDYRSHVEDESSRKWSNAMLGQTDVRDPATGDNYKVTSGHNYYFGNGNTVVGNDTGTPPDIDFKPLQEW